MNAQRARYEQSIRKARIGTAILVGGWGFSLVVCARHGLKLGTFISSIGLIVSLGLVGTLILEQILVAWFSARQGRISLLDLFDLTAASAIFF